MEAGSVEDCEQLIFLKFLLMFPEKKTLILNRYLLHNGPERNSIYVFIILYMQLFKVTELLFK